jgi:hypothetical protein
MWSLSSWEEAYGSIISEPMTLLYRHAPAVGGIGGWSGFDKSQICARLSGQSEGFWDTHSYECDQMVQTRLNSFAITGQTILYFFLLFRAFHCIMNMSVRILGGSVRGLWVQKATTGGIIPFMAPGVSTVVYYGAAPPWVPTGTSGGLPRMQTEEDILQPLL